MRESSSGPPSQPAHTAAYTSGVFTYPSRPKVVYGTSFDAAVSEQAEALNVSRLFVLVSRSLQDNTALTSRLRSYLGGRIVAEFSEMPAHTPRSAVLAATKRARDAGCDCVVTLGGGSITDAGKMVRLCIANDVVDEDGLDPFYTRTSSDGSVAVPTTRAPTIPMISVPTTLSSGEYSATAGCTDVKRGLKQSFAHPDMTASCVVLDPEACLATPDWLWCSTGIRAVDHSVSDICATQVHPLAQASAIHALKQLSAGLRASHANPDDRDARLRCLLGGWLSMIGSQTGVRKGASHGIGHVLGGSMGVPHGHTSCVLLPAVLRWNSAVNAERQRSVSEALGEPDRAAADLVQSLISGLGLPSRLRDVGVTRERFPEIAEKSMLDRFVHSNPRAISGPQDIIEILDLAW